MPELSEVATLTEIIRMARATMKEPVWTFVTGGAESETTLRRNRQGLDERALRPRIMRDVREIDMSTTLLDTKLRIPVFMAPCGGVTQMDPGGTLAIVKAGGEFGTLGWISSVAQPNLEEVRAGSDAPAVFQIYVRGDNDWLLERLAKAGELGYQAFCVTADTAYSGRNERRMLAQLAAGTPARRNESGMEFQAALNWDHIDLLRENSKIPLVLKGVATADDARIAVDHGIDVVYVSNHGGRQLDQGYGSIDVLADIVDAVGEQVDIVVDGGFSRGTDVLKAIALGAKAVGIGRLYCLGLAAGGQAGVVRVLELLEEEIKMAMGLLGVTSLSQLDPSYLGAASAVNEPSMTSAHPFALLGS